MRNKRQIGECLGREIVVKEIERRLAGVTRQQTSGQGGGVKLRCVVGYEAILAVHRPLATRWRSKRSIVRTVTAPLKPVKQGKKRCTVPLFETKAINSQRGVERYWRLVVSSENARRVRGDGERRQRGRF